MQYERIDFEQDMLNFQIKNRDLNEDFYQDSTYVNILGQGVFSEVRKVKHRVFKKMYCVKTYRLPILEQYDQNTAFDLPR